MKVLIFIALVMTSGASEVYIDDHNKRIEIKQFARDTINVIPNQSRLAYYESGRGKPLENLIFLTEAGSSDSTVSVRPA